jgi:hypothetical protein
MQSLPPLFSFIVEFSKMHSNLSEYFFKFRQNISKLCIGADWVILEYLKFKLVL